MAGTYAILCLSHDPATRARYFSTPEDAAAQVAAGLPEHPHCDLMIGRYSGALLAMGCPPVRCPATVIGHHRVQWADTPWLRVLAATHGSSNPDVQRQLLQPELGCWTPARLFRLRMEMDAVVPDVIGPGTSLEVHTSPS